MKHPNNLYSRLTLITSITLVVGYFIVQAATLYYTDLPNVGTGSGLTSTSWNNLVNYANKAIKQDTEILTVTGGRVGIGTTNPRTALDIENGTNGLPPTSGNANAGMMRLNNAGINVTMDFGTLGTTSPYPGWIQVHDANNWASNFPLILNPNGGNVGIGTSSPRVKLDIVGDLMINGAVYKTQILVLPGNTTQILKVDIAGSYGFYEIKVAGYGSSGAGSCLIAWMDGGHGGGTTYHHLQETARITQGNPVLGAIIETTTGGSISLQNTSSTPIQLLITVISHNSAGETSFAVLQ